MGAGLVGRAFFVFGHVQTIHLKMGLALGDTLSENGERATWPIDRIRVKEK